MNGEALAEHERWMRAALNLGRRTMGRAAPNPAVASLVVKDGIVLGRGVTAPGGRPHAEPLALAEAGEAARGSTLYVTLEPCSHYGKTPPCTTAIVAAGVTTVVYALGDPDARVAGRGLAQLQEAGVAVVGPVASDAARRDHLGHILRVTVGRPAVTLKLAETADGFAAHAAGPERLLVTGAAANAAVHRLRSLHDAVMVGIGTACADNPQLTVRLPGTRPRPARIVLDSRLRLPLGSALVGTVDAAPLVVVAADDAEASRAAALQARGAIVLHAPCGPRGLDLDRVLKVLGGHGFTRVFCEGGPALGSALVAQGLADTVTLITGRRVLGDGLAALDAGARRTIANPTLYRAFDDRPLGDDRLRSYERLPPCSPDS